MNSQSWYIHIRDPIDAACARAETYLVNISPAGSSHSLCLSLESSLHIHITHDVQYHFYTFGMYVLRAREVHSMLVSLVPYLAHVEVICSQMPDDICNHNSESVVI